MLLNQNQPLFATVAKPAFKYGGTGFASPTQQAAAHSKQFDFGGAEKQRAALEAKMKGSKLGSQQQLSLANQLADMRNKIQAAKTAAGMPLKHAVGVSGQDMVSTLQRRAGVLPTGATNPQPTAPGQGQAPTQGAPTQSQPGQTPSLGGGLSSPQMPNPQLPGYPAPPNSPFPQTPYDSNNPSGMLSSVYDQATGGSLQSFNTAANRLRERLDSASAGQSDAATNKNLSRGFGNSGLNSADQYQIQAGTQNAYAQELNDLSSQMEDRRLKGLDTALGAATSAREGQDAYYKNLYDLLNGRETRANNLGIAQGGWNNNIDLSKINQDTALQTNKLSNQTSQYNNSLSNLFNIPGLFGAIQNGSGGSIDLTKLFGQFGGSAGGGSGDFTRSVGGSF